MAPRRPNKGGGKGNGKPGKGNAKTPPPLLSPTDQQYYENIGAALETPPAPASTFDRKSAIDIANDMLAQYGLKDFGIDVQALVDQYGENTELYGVGIRNTETYKKRFDGLIKLRNSGNTYGITNEGQYLALENEYRTIFRQANLSSQITDASGSDYTSIADLISKYNLSSEEVKSRISDAQRVVNDTAPEVKAALRDFYNIGENDLLAYSLNPANAMDDINRKANAATFAGIARQSGLNVSEQYARETMQNIYGAEDINRGNVQKALQTAASTQQETSRLAQIEGGTLSAEETISSTLGTSAEAEKKIRGLQSRERARFAGTSAISKGTLRRRGGGV